MTNDKDHPDEIEEIDCIEAINGLYAYLDGEMEDPEAVDKFEHHLEHCRACYSRTQLERALNSRIKQVSKEQTPDSLKKRLKNVIDKL